MKISLLRSISTFIALFAIYIISSSSSNGTTGSPTTGCSCHGVASLTTSVTFSGFPAYYNHGQNYPIQVTVHNISKTKAGFKLGVNIGTLNSPGTGVTIASPLEAYQTAPKTMVAGDAIFNLMWTAPSTGNTIVSVNCAGIGADGNTLVTNDIWNTAKSVNIPLPVTLLDFNVARINNSNLITWTSENEVNLKQYIIEKSYDAVHFNELSTIASRNAFQNKYSFTDNSYYGTIYYRLKSVDIDGTTSLSNVIHIKNTIDNPVVIANNSIIINDALKNVTLYVYTMLGSRILSTSNTLNTSSLQHGAYILSLIDNKTKEKLYTQTFIK